MEQLFRRPATLSAARLAGVRSFLPARPCEGGIALEGWGITLPQPASRERVTVAVPDDAVLLDGGAYTAVVQRVIHDLDGDLVLLRPEGAADAPPLQALLPKGSTAEVGRTLRFGLSAERCLCYDACGEIFSADR